MSGDIDTCLDSKLYSAFSSSLYMFLILLFFIRTLGIFTSMSRQEDIRKILNRNRLILTLAMIFLDTCHGCFPIYDVFQGNLYWRQQMSTETYTIMTLSLEDHNIMFLKYYEEQKLVSTVKLWCLLTHGSNKFLVRQTSEVVDDDIYFCMHLNLLAPNIVRMSKTSTSYLRKKFSCLSLDYIQDEYVWFINVRYFDKPCPLTGGFQLIFNADNLAISPSCSESIFTYNPKVQLQCDTGGSGNVIIDLGEACEFKNTRYLEHLLHRNFLYFRCMGHWRSESTTSVLLQMEADELQVWCLQYKMILPEDGFMPLHLSLTGFCPSDAFPLQLATWSINSIYGALGQYRQMYDPECNTTFQTDCQLESACRSSNRCPVQCNRCEPVKNISMCNFHESVHGDWTPINLPSKNIFVNVQAEVLKCHFGYFGCRGTPMMDDTGVFQYRVEQDGLIASCRPLYACVELKLLAQGILFFHIIIAERRSQTGEPNSCFRTMEIYDDLNLLRKESPLTLFDLSELHETQCNFPYNTFYFTTLPHCRLLIHNCSNDCTILKVKLDRISCSNRTVKENPIFETHHCMEKIDFEDDTFAIVSYNRESKAFLCWVFASSRLLIVSPEECNEEAANTILSNPKSPEVYDPLILLSRKSFQLFSQSCVALLLNFPLFTLSIIVLIVYPPIR
ncbi:hypothetical protein Bpfe_030640 [Biomphalaria pfeifferi]|uniref:Uncharacterized protein n=1 Tax=Biomphalaria pfeifferi TaxID=112525 RepID=A0AAD8AS52_BIOPF|nr:hypothetical protein Bpfe_030640 [Biomphalaria pfeifferi]